MLDRTGRALFGAALAIGVICSTGMVTRALVRIRGDEAIRVTGSARRLVRAEAMVWTTHLTVRADELADGYRRLEGAAEKVGAYLEGHGIAAAQRSISVVRVEPIHARTPDGLRETDRVIAFNMGQSIEARSAEMAALRRLSLQSSDLMAACGLAERGVGLTSDPPRYVYGTLERIKHEVLAEASANARERAQRIAAASGGRLGRLRAAHLTDVQILSEGSSNRYSDDVSSPEKFVVVDVEAAFELD